MRIYVKYLFIVIFGLTSCSESLDPEKQFYEGEYSNAFSLWQPLAKQGNLEASNYLGIHYYMGLGVKRDFRKAAYWFRLAAEQGHADAQYNLGLMYENGQYVKQDFTEAYIWLFAAYKQGNTHSEKHMQRLAREHKLLPNQIQHAQKLALKYIK